jgi:glycosyltransferase involved in cell wall biosynthesis
LRFLKFLYPKTKLVQGVRWDVLSLPTKLTKWFKFFETKFYFLLDGYITNTNVAKKALIGYGVKEEKIVTIHNGIQVLGENTKTTNRIKKVLTIANFFPVKGHIAYLQVIKKVLKNIDDVEFLLVGRDEMFGKVQQEIKNLNLNTKVKCLPFQDSADLFKVSDIFVLPSLSEGFPTVLLESFCYKLPVIAYKVGGISELVEHKKEGLLSEKQDITSMANNIIELLENPKKCQQFGEMGYKKIKEKFTLEVMLEKHNNYFKSIK